MGLETQAQKESCGEDCVTGAVTFRAGMHSALKREARVLDTDLTLLPPHHLLPLLPFGQIRCQNTVDPGIPVMQLSREPPGLRAGRLEEGSSRGTAARDTQHSELLFM